MELSEKDLKKIVLILLFIAIGVLTFLVVRPVLLSVFAGLILAYIFFPVYKLVKRVVRWSSVAAGIVSILVLAIIFIPLWFLVPMMIQQIFGIFQLSQGLDVTGVISKFLPAMSDQVVNQIDLAIKNALNNITSSILNSLVSLLSNLATILLHLLIIAFVFFFALKDEAKFRAFVSEISPLNKTQEKILVKQFKDMTSAIINGHVVAGFIQGVLAGIALFVAGVPNALVLTIFAIILGVFPTIGPGLVYVPVTIYLIATGHSTTAIIYLLYNLLIVSTIDNVIRIYVASRKTDISQALVVIGMVGGLFLFGVLGLILGPLIIGYFITFLEAYKNKTLSSFFSE
jgi:predicted PurR-regulated permease PerM